MGIDRRSATRFICVLTVCGLASLLLPTTQAVAQQKLTYIDLINRLTDLEYPATLPAPGEKCAQQSSWDRASKYDEATGKYVRWDANGDGNGIIRKEGNQLTLNSSA